MVGFIGLSKTLKLKCQRLIKVGFDEQHSLRNDMEIRKANYQLVLYVLIQRQQ